MRGLAAEQNDRQARNGYADRPVDAQDVHTEHLICHRYQASASRRYCNAPVTNAELSWDTVLGNEYKLPVSSSLSKYFLHSGNTRQLAMPVDSKPCAQFHHCLQCWSLTWKHCWIDGRPVFVSHSQSRNMA